MERSRGHYSCSCVTGSPARGAIFAGKGGEVPVFNSGDVPDFSGDVPDFKRGS